ncbi:MAG: glycosyl hydrolase [Bacteroidota bacterium]
MKSNYYYIIFTGLLVFACNKKVQVDQTITQTTSEERPLAKFEPINGETLVFVGQDLESIGGLKEYDDGYTNHFPVPAGITLYTGLSSNDGSFGGDNEKGLSGVYETVDHGNGPSNMSMLLEDPKFKHTSLAIGLSLVNYEDKVADGSMDDSIKQLGEFLLSLGDRPVFLRIGYEFDGYPWNHYEREPWLEAYKRIKDMLDEQGVTNTAYVWQSVGWVSNLEQLEAWYPGDEYVDWCGFSFFNRWRENRMIEFAREKGKPVFIAEASATISDFTAKFDGKTKETILSNPHQATEAWNKWFVPFFKTIEENRDVIKAVHYINCNWKARPMWFENPTFQSVDARIETSPLIREKWLEKVGQPEYLHSSEDLFTKLNID